MRTMAQSSVKRRGLNGLIAGLPPGAKETASSHPGVTLPAAPSMQVQVQVSVLTFCTFYPHRHQLPPLPIH